MLFVQRLIQLGRTPMGSMILVTGLVLSASGVNFIAQALLAYRFGTGAEVDSYAFSLSLPLFVAGLIGSIVSYTVIPLIAGHGDDPARQQDIASATTLIAFAMGAILALASLPSLVLQPRALPAGSAVAANPHLPALIIAAWMIAATQAISAVMVAQLNARQRPLTAALLALPPGFGTIAAVLLFAHSGTLLAALGFLTGSIFAAGLGLFLQRKTISLRPHHLDMRAEATVLLRKAVWAALALSCFSSFAVSDAYWAARMPEGSLAALGYVQRIIIGVGSLIVAGPSALFVPRFAQFARNGDYAGFRRLLLRTLLAVCGLGLAAVLAFYFFSHEIVTVLFRRGAFNDDDVALLSALLRAMGPGVVAMLSVVMLMRAAFCLAKTELVAAALGLGWCVLYFSLSGLLHVRGAIGIAESYSISWITMAAALLAYVFHMASSSVTHQSEGGLCDLEP